MNIDKAKDKDIDIEPVDKVVPAFLTLQPIACWKIKYIYVYI